MYLLYICLQVDFDLIIRYTDSNQKLRSQRGIAMKPVKDIITEEIRQAWMNTLVQTGESTFAFVDEDQSQAEFDLWLQKERNRVADLAMAKERKRIIKLFQDMIDENIRDKSDGTPGWAIWAKNTIEGSVSDPITLNSTEPEEAE
jgi:hypothetical protein